MNQYTRFVIMYTIGWVFHLHCGWVRYKKKKTIIMIIFGTNNIDTNKCGVRKLNLIDVIDFCLKLVLGNCFQRNVKLWLIEMFRKYERLTSGEPYIGYQYSTQISKDHRRVSQFFSLQFAMFFQLILNRNAFFKIV